MRNVLIYDLSRAIDRYASRVKFVEVSINGSYNGLYVFMDKLKEIKRRKNNDPEEIIKELQLQIINLLQIDKKNNGKVMMKGILQKADTLNQNGRIYPIHVLDREVRNYQKFIVENRALGELDHPEKFDVSLKNISHMMITLFLY